MTNAETKVAVVTGASQGIGAALVQGFRSRNYHVVALSRSIKPSADPNVVAVQGDVADPKTADSVFQGSVGPVWPRRYAGQQRRHVHGKTLYCIFERRLCRLRGDQC